LPATSQSQQNGYQGRQQTIAVTETETSAMTTVSSDTPPIFSSRITVGPETAEEIRADKGPDRLADRVAANRIGATMGKQ
jgi:hypothetical protein